MHSKVQRYKLRNLGIALVINMVLGLFLCLFPWHLVPLSGLVNSTIAPYRYLVGFISGLLALLASRTEKGYYPILFCLIGALIASLVLTYLEHHHNMDAMVDLNLFLQAIIIYTFLQIRASRKDWEKIIQTPPRTLDLHIEGKSDLFNRMVMSPHLEVNPEILRNVDHFLEIQTDYAPLVVCIYSAETVSDHLQKVAHEAYQMYYQDQERKLRNFIQSRYSRSIWMIVISIIAFRFMSLWGEQRNSAAFWEVLSSFAAFSLWKVGDTYFEHTEAMHRLANVLIAKNAEIQFM